MFDILVDTAKKRLGLMLIFTFSLVEIGLLADLLFGLEVLKSSQFSQLIALAQTHQDSFYAYFFFSCLSSGVAYLDFTITTGFRYLILIFKAFSLLDWVLLLVLLALFISHHSKLSKIALCWLGGYWFLRLLILGGISFYLLEALNAQNATVALARIQTSSIFLVFSHAFALAMNTYGLYQLIKKHYLTTFEKNA